MTPPLPRLLTFAPMVDSETTRLLCRWYGIAHVEDDHLFGWVSLLTLRHGGYGRVPLLHGKGLRLSGPRPVADRFDPLAARERRLLPDGPDRASVEADWTGYNGTLALDVAVFAYYHLLPARDLMIPIFAEPVPPREKALTPRVYPLLAWLFRIVLQLNRERADAAEQRIRTLFGDLDRRLADGRRFLLGERMTLGDIALAGAAAPLLQPAGYGARMPPIDAMPLAIRDLVQQLRVTATSTYIERVYAHVDASTL